MKAYKPTYGSSFLFMWAIICIGFSPSLILLSILAAITGYAPFGEIFLGSIAGMLLFGLAYLLFILLLNIFIRPFIRKTVDLTEYAISYAGKTLRLNSIRYITLYLPNLMQKTAPPTFLVLWADDKNYIEIKHPSFTLITAVKRQCAHAVFDVDDWKALIKQCLFIQGIVLAGIVAAVIFGFQ